MRQNNILGDIEDTSRMRGNNTERVTSVTVDPVSLTWGLGASGTANLAFLSTREDKVPRGRETLASY